MSDIDATQWPPPPMHPSVDVLEVGRVRMVRTENRLTVTNFAAKRDLWINIALSFFIIPLMMSMTVAFIIVFAEHILGYKVIIDERARRLLIHALSPTIKGVFFFTAFMAALLAVYSWFWYIYYLHRGLFVLDKQRNVFQRGGRELHPLYELKTVTIKPPVRKFFKRWQVELTRPGGDPRPRWRQRLHFLIRLDTTQIAALRVREDAEQIAATVADFASVPIERSEK